MLTELDLQREAVRKLGGWAHGLSIAEAPETARRALDDVLLNFLAVTIGGAQTPALETLRRRWNPEPGACSLLGTGLRVPAETAAWLNAVAAVQMERDEGNRAAAGHPAVQSFPAVLALAERLKSDGATTRTALLVAYEVAARFGASTDFVPTVHTHGTFGVTGAAAGCAVLLGLNANGIARAIDAACALPLSTNWEAVLRGSSIRDQWVGAVNVNGLAAARFAAAYPRELVGGMSPGFGGGLGQVDTSLLADGLGEYFHVEHGYFKQYSSCAYTHAAADAAQILHRTGAAGDGFDPKTDIAHVEVVTTAQAAKLTATEWPSRHAAYFSVPFAVASMLVFGDVAYNRSDPGLAGNKVLLALAPRIAVRAGTGSRAGDRFADVTVHLRDGRTYTSHVDNPEGDSNHAPFSAFRKRRLAAEALTQPGHGRSPSIDQLEAALAALKEGRRLADALDLVLPEQPVSVPRRAQETHQQSVERDIQ